MLTEYLTELLAGEFIQEHTDKQGRKTYTLTDKGHNYLKDYSTIKSFLESYGLE